MSLDRKATLRKLIMPGPFPGGLVAVEIGVMILCIIPERPEATTSERAAAHAKLLGRIGGGLIGLGAVMMLAGLWRALR